MRQITHAFDDISFNLDAYFDKFALLPNMDDPLWLKVLIDIATLSVTIVFSSVISNFNKQLPHFIENPKRFDFTKELPGGMLTNGMNEAKTPRELSKKYGIWKAEDQHDTEAWIGELQK
ncbi:hypothetical protein VHEMI07296 [[Torrubiella] hemipterigena]|uniref:Uncharacterized protein n=1 Tax=[Torrubiella] hemipterigena TaxID=1531966 RepID=A0A0A1T9X3_9HYPO|nr:hypothetical protein VHEMI07296 [[Torrubiella] hemipterigena]